MNIPRIFYLLFYPLCLIPFQSQGQQLLVDQGVRLEGLWCFPLHADTLTYMYLSPEAHISLDKQNHPQFSFLRYIINQPTDSPSAHTMTDADGGGILHFLINYDTPQEQVQAAEKQLQKIPGKADARIMGPVLYDSGRYMLVSSILSPEEGSPQQKLMASGEAPVLEGSRMALSFELNPTDSKLLLESFKMATPDISLTFDLTFHGLTHSYDAKLEVDWEQVRQSHSFSAGGNYYFLGGEIKGAFDRLRRDNAIRLTTNGGHEPSEALVNTAYNKLLEVMFEPLEPVDFPQEKKGGMMDALLGMMKAKGKSNSTGFTGEVPAAFSLNIGYQFQDLRTSGQSVMYFQGRSEVERHHYITFNAGNLYQEYGENKQVFRDVPLWDPAFQQREIFIGIDGALESEFDRLLNSVTVTLRKKHQGGEQTLKELILKRNTFQDYEGPLSLIYGFQEDHDRNAWMDYEYRADWQFQGGGGYTTSWTSHNAAMINLFTPYQRKKIELAGDMEALVQQGIRAAIVQISYDFFEERKTHRLTLRPGDRPEDKSIEISLPLDQQEITYEIRWIRSDGDRLIKRGSDPYGLIFIDELPREIEKTRRSERLE